MSECGSRKRTTHIKIYFRAICNSCWRIGSDWGSFFRQNKIVTRLADKERRRTSPFHDQYYVVYWLARDKNLQRFNIAFWR